MSSNKKIINLHSNIVASSFAESTTSKGEESLLGKDTAVYQIKVLISMELFYQIKVLISMELCHRTKKIIEFYTQVCKNLFSILVNLANERSQKKKERHIHT